MSWPANSYVIQQETNSRTINRGNFQFTEHRQNVAFENALNFVDGSMGALRTLVTLVDLGERDLFVIAVPFNSNAGIYASRRCPGRGSDGCRYFSAPLGNKSMDQ
jgi:hypothetical protein